MTQSYYADPCFNLRMALRNQARVMRAAAENQQRACTSGTSLECSQLTAASEAAASTYRNLLQQYHQCMQGSMSFSRLFTRGYVGGMLMDPLDFEFEF